MGVPCPNEAPTWWMLSLDITMEMSTIHHYFWTPPMLRLWQSLLVVDGNSHCDRDTTLDLGDQGIAKNKNMAMIKLVVGHAIDYCGHNKGMCYKSLKGSTS